MNTDSADIIAALKKEVEDLKDHTISLTIASRLEACLVANELEQARVGVVQLPARPYPTTWERRRM